MIRGAGGAVYPYMSQYLAAIGAVRIKPLGAPVFFVLASRALKAAQRAEGCRFAGTHFRDGKAFSLTVWDSPADMKRFAKGPGHKPAMDLAWIAAETFHFCHFPVDTTPGWDEAIAKWAAKSHPEALVQASDLRQKRAFD